MKDEIYTIPVNDGFKEPCECPFCAMQQKLENDMLDFVLSPSYMEEDVRGETNEKGFCRTHMEQLYRRDNALGVALIMQSQFDHQRKKVLNLAKGGGPAKKGGLSPTTLNIFFFLFKDTRRWLIIPTSSLV